MEKKDLHAIESNLWNMANHLRGKMDASEYKNYILAFMFYKYLSSRQNDTTREFFGEEMEEGQSSAFFLLDRIFETEDVSVIRKYASDSNGFTKLFVENLKNSYKLKNSQKSCYLSDFRLFSFSPKR